MAFKLLLTVMTHDYNSREKKHGNGSNDDDSLTNTKLEENIMNHINATVGSIRYEFLNLKDIVIKRLQDENSHLQSKCKSLEDKVTSLEENLNSHDQYGKRNNIVLSGIPECVADNALEATVASILADIDVDVDSNALEACHRFGKPERTTKSRKTIVRFTNRKYCKKALLNRKKLANGFTDE